VPHNQNRARNIPVSNRLLNDGIDVSKVNGICGDSRPRLSGHAKPGGRATTNAQ
jgi:hypothetical protein